MKSLFAIRIIKIDEWLLDFNQYRRNFIFESHENYPLMASERRRIHHQQYFIFKFLFINNSNYIYWISLCFNLFQFSRGSSFVEFLKGLKSFIQSTACWNTSDYLILIDNAPTHHSKTVKTLVEQEKMNIAFIPSYLPELAPIEKYLSLLKRITIKRHLAIQLIGRKRDHWM